MFSLRSSPHTGAGTENDSASLPPSKKKQPKETIIEEPIEVTCAGAQKRRRDSTELKSKNILKKVISRPPSQKNNSEEPSHISSQSPEKSTEPQPSHTLYSSPTPDSPFLCSVCSRSETREKSSTKKKVTTVLGTDSLRQAIGILTPKNFEVVVDSE